MNLELIFENNKKWVADKLKVDDNYFENLSKGQSPEILYIGCSDSRVTAEEITGAHPGDIFVYRNIANMVSNIDLGSQSVLEYAVVHLKVKQIIVVGHYFCGGVMAAMQSADLGILNPYLRNIRDVYRLHKEELNAITDETARYKRLVELNVQEQCINVLKTACVQRAFNSGQLDIHGWVFDIQSGKLIDLDMNMNEKMKDIMEIYHLD
ncbi:carbonic anhydrase [Persicobacter psychrovividus]|uniref:Carbonic anhydrase n=1 Tax=Persicobacter psychrovividus TaxID=387638 RepID=A0ABM7VKS1_9BACT|nr:carbonic anhydrase [Persicobacter psychrovividus]